MKILGIDPGTARMGYSVVEIDGNKSPLMIETDVLITPSEAAMQNRLKLLYKGISEILEKHNPSIMVVEKLFFNTNVKTAITVGQARGIVMLAAADKQMHLFEYTALQAKLALTGYGRASKKEMQEAVKTCLGLDNIIKSDDANDALAIALCFIKKDFDAFLNGVSTILVMPTSIKSITDKPSQKSTSKKSVPESVPVKTTKKNNSKVNSIKAKLKVSKKPVKNTSATKKK
jgi:crossover junction endodeoxyribonuclease RuvC